MHLEIISVDSEVDEILSLTTVCVCVCVSHHILNNSCKVFSRQVKFVVTVTSLHRCIRMKGWTKVNAVWNRPFPVAARDQPSLSFVVSRWMLTATFFSPLWRWTMRWCRPTSAAASVTHGTPSCPLTAPECSSASPWLHGTGSATTRWTAAPCAVAPTAG